MYTYNVHVVCPYAYTCMYTYMGVIEVFTVYINVYKYTLPIQADFVRSLYKGTIKTC